MEFAELEISKPGPLYLQISDILKQKIISNDIRIGDKLPTQRELCRIFKVSNDTIQDAFDRLAREGFISGKTRHGTVVVTDNPAVKLQINSDSAICLVLCIQPVMSVEGMFFYSFGFYEAEGSNNVTMPNRVNLYRAVIKNKELIYENRKDNISGYLLAGHVTPECVDIIRNLKLPFVVEGDVLDNGKLLADIDIVTDDDFEKFYGITRRLVGFGHKKILYLNDSFDSVPWKADALNGYKKALTDAGIVPDDNLRMEIKGDTRQVYSQLKEYMDKPIGFTGIVSSNFSWCVTAKEILLQKGLKIPDDISVICSDASGFFSYYLCSKRTIAIRATQRLLERINNPSEKIRKTFAPNTFYDLGTTAKAKLNST